MPEFQLQGAASFEPQRFDHRFGLVAANGEPRHAAAEGAWAVGAGFENDALVAGAARKPEGPGDGQSDHADDGDDHGAPALLPVSRVYGAD